MRLRAIIWGLVLSAPLWFGIGFGARQLAYGATSQAISVSAPDENDGDCAGGDEECEDDDGDEGSAI